MAMLLTDGGRIAIYSCSLIREMKVGPLTRIALKNLKPYLLQQTRLENRGLAHRNSLMIESWSTLCTS